jgi:hypothetical protein
MVRHRAKTVIVVTIVLAAVSGAAVVASAQGTIPTDAQRLECERNGGYWVTATGSCKIGSKDTIKR